MTQYEAAEYLGTSVASIKRRFKDIYKGNVKWPLNRNRYFSLSKKKVNIKTMQEKPSWLMTTTIVQRTRYAQSYSTTICANQKNKSSLHYIVHSKSTSDASILDKSTIAMLELAFSLSQ